jgi:hypothetical protein
VNDDDDTTYCVTWEVAVSHKATLTGAQIRERFGMSPKELGTFCDEEHDETDPLNELTNEESPTITHPPVLTGVSAVPPGWEEDQRRQRPQHGVAR